MKLEQEIIRKILHLFNFVTNNFYILKRVVISLCYKLEAIFTTVLYISEFGKKEFLYNCPC